MVKLARPQVMIKLSTKHKQGLRRPMKSPNNEDREKKQLSILRLGQHLELLCHAHQCTYRDISSVKNCGAAQTAVSTPSFRSHAINSCSRLQASLEQKPQK